MPVNKQQLQHAQSLHQHGRLDDALHSYLEILSENPDDINVIQLVGVLHVQQGDLSAARTFIEKALQRLPQEASLYNSLGNVLAREDKLAEAIEAYQKALKINPDYPGALSNLGNCYFRQQQFSEAQDYYQQAIHIDPHYPDAYFNLARVYLQQEQKAAAIAQLEKVLEMAPQHAGALGQLGTTYLLDADYQRAIAYFNKRLTIQPNHIETYHSLATAYIHLMDYSQAIEALTRCLELNPNYPEAFHALATAYLLKGDQDKALTYYLQQLEQQPNLDSLYNIGVILSNKQRHNESIDYLQQALKLEPKHLPSHLNLAALYLKKKMTALAIQHYQIAATLDPNNLEIKHILHALTQDELPAEAPAVFSENLFNQYAPSYDKHLQQYLNYQLPHELHRQIMPLINPHKHSLRILDLGCGTGLSGAVFKDSSKEMIGIDVSAEMLALAKEKAIYQTLIHEPIETALPRFSKIDLVIAADVFPYFGELTPIFKEVYRTLCHGGWFAFSIEKTKKNPYVLQKTIRYAHHKNYVESVCSDCGFEVIEINNVILRFQEKKPLEGYLFILKKP